jgi:hypothetical protein
VTGDELQMAVVVGVVVVAVVVANLFALRSWRPRWRAGGV